MVVAIEMTMETESPLALAVVVARTAAATMAVGYAYTAGLYGCGRSCYLSACAALC